MPWELPYRFCPRTIHIRTQKRSPRQIVLLRRDRGDVQPHGAKLSNSSAVTAIDFPSDRNGCGTAHSSASSHAWRATNSASRRGFTSATSAASRSFPRNLRALTNSRAFSASFFLPPILPVLGVSNFPGLRINLKVNSRVEFLGELVNGNCPWKLQHRIPSAKSLPPEEGSRERLIGKPQCSQRRKKGEWIGAVESGQRKVV